MAGLFSTLNTANKGLTAQQMALGTVGHNVSNANTRGYTRQRVDMVADRAYKYPGIGQVGTGVNVVGVTRTVDIHLARQVRNSVGVFEKYGAKNEGLKQLEAIYNEPSKTGLNNSINEMFVSWAELGENPEMLTAKTVVVEKSKTFADTVKHMAEKINGLKTDTEANIKAGTLELNANLDKLKKLNEDIINSSIRGDVPNDLLDKRDLLLQDMSQIVNLETGDGTFANFDEYGRANVKIGDVEVLSYAGDKKQLEYKDGKIMAGTTDITGQVKEGQLKGHLEVIEEVDKNIEDFNNFIKVTADAINTVHSDDGNGLDFFTYEDSDPIGTLAVNDEIAKDNRKVAASKDLTGGPTGDGSRAQEIAKLQEVNLDYADGIIKYDPNTMKIEPTKNGMTIKNAYSEIITKVAVETKHAYDMMDNQFTLTNQLMNRQEAISGVSLNEEISDMIKFQQSYNANARVIQTVSEMLDTFINRTVV